MKQQSKVKCAIIGSTKIAEIHAREFIKNKINNIMLISRSKIKSRKFSLSLGKKFGVSLRYGDHNSLNREKFDIISICSKAKYHLQHLKKIKNQKSKIIVEKPLFNIKSSRNINLDLNNIYSMNKKLFVVYPMYYLALLFKRKFNFKDKVKKIEVYYQTRGKHIGEGIFLDLAPHVLMIILALTNLRSFEKIKIYDKKIDKNQFFLNAKLPKLKFKIRLLQLKNRKKSIFKFKINDNYINRHTSIINNKFCNFLKFKNKKMSINNPMSLVLKNFIQYNYTDSQYKKNKRLTYILSNFTKKIYDTNF